jgi:hypothetical protein
MPEKERLKSKDLLSRNFEKQRQSLKNLMSILILGLGKNLTPGGV